MKLLLTLILCTLACVAYAYGQKTEPATDTAKVIRVTDGDTIHVLYNGKYETVRIIGLNAPELKSEDARTKCLANIAMQKADDLLTDMSVTLEADPSQADRDKYGRLLRYVFWNKDNFSLYMIKKGFAYEYTYNKAYKYQQEFKDAQKYAQESKWGIWDPETCK